MVNIYMKRIHIILFAILFICHPALALQLGAGQNVGSTVRAYDSEKRRNEVKKRTTEERVKAPGLYEEELKELPEGVDMVYIQKVVLQQDPGLEDMSSPEELFSAAGPYEERRITLEDMRALVKRLTEIVADEKIRIYLPKQSMADGVLYINFIESD